MDVLFCVYNACVVCITKSCMQVNLIIKCAMLCKFLRTTVLGLITFQASLQHPQKYHLVSKHCKSQLVIKNVERKTFKGQKGIAQKVTLDWCITTQSANSQPDQSPSLIMATFVYPLLPGLPHAIPQSSSIQYKLLQSPSSLLRFHTCDTNGEMLSICGCYS